MFSLHPRNDGTLLPTICVEWGLANWRNFKTNPRCALEFLCPPSWLTISAIVGSMLDKWALCRRHRHERPHWSEQSPRFRASVLCIYAFWWFSTDWTTFWPGYWCLAAPKHVLTSMRDKGKLTSPLACHLHFICFFSWIICPVKWKSLKILKGTTPDWVLWVILYFKFKLQCFWSKTKEISNPICYISKENDSD